MYHSVGNRGVIITLVDDAKRPHEAFRPTVHDVSVADEASENVPFFSDVLPENIDPIERRGMIAGKSRLSG